MNLHKRKIDHYKKAIKHSEEEENPFKEVRLATTRKDLLKFKKEGIKKVKWVASAGDRTCPICEDLNGKTFDIDNVPKRPHKDCRCAIIKIK